MSHSTLLTPPELPPFHLQVLLSSAFVVSSDSVSNSSSLARLGQLVTNATADHSTTTKNGKAVVIKSVEARRETIYVGNNLGVIKIYSAKSPEEEEDVTESTPGRSESIASPPMSPIRGDTAQNEVEELDLVEAVTISSGKKSIDRIALLERIGRVAILSEGLLTFHSLPSLAPLPVQAFPSMKGVVAFSLDEDELSGGGTREAMHICAIRRRAVFILRVTREGVTAVGDLPLPGGALLASLRRRHICIADAEEYSIVDLDKSILLPVIPISQGVNADLSPVTPDPHSTTPAPSSGIDPRQRPVIACVGTNEFLLASHTGSSTLGVFVTETGEACRGTLEWSSNLRSIYIDSIYVISLLHNGTLEVHSLDTLQIVQVLHLPSINFFPRSLAPLAFPFDVVSAKGLAKVETITLPLLPRLSTSASPATPTRPRIQRRESIKKNRSISCKTLLVGKNSIAAIVPLTLVAQLDALIETDRLTHALELATRIEQSGTSSSATNAELSYVFLRAAYLLLESTRFEEAFDLFFRSKCDPRLVVRLFEDLRSPLMSEGEDVRVCRGVEQEVREGKTIDDYVIASLTHNYSPHLEPNIETASSSTQLRSILVNTARDCLCEYLSRWRQIRRRNGGSINTSGEGDSRKVNIVIDTTLIRLFAEDRRREDILALLQEPNDCVLVLVEPCLLEAGMFTILSDIFLKRGDVAKTLEIWTKLVDGVYEEDGFESGVELVYGLLITSSDSFIVEKYGLWLIGHDRSLGVKLFTDPSQTLVFDTRNLAAKISKIDEFAGDLFLESTVLQKRDNDSGLHSDLVKRYIDRLMALSADPITRSHCRDQESSYSDLVSLNPSTTPSFLTYLTSRYDPQSSHAIFDRIRLKAILFLGTSSNYDLLGTKKALEEMELKGFKGLTLERAVVYGRLRLDRQALSLLLLSLGDLMSSETYVHQSGDPLLSSDLASTATLLQLPLPPSRAVNMSTTSSGGRERELARLLIEMCLLRRSGAAYGDNPNQDERADGRIDGRKEQVARILETQAIHLETIEILPIIPGHWPLSLVSTYLSRSLRRSLHARQEGALLKSIAMAENAFIHEQVLEQQLKCSGVMMDQESRSRVDAVKAQKEEEEEEEEEAMEIKLKRNPEKADVEDLL